MSELDPVEVVITVDTSAFDRYVTLPEERYSFDTGDFERQVRSVRTVMGAAAEEVAKLRDELIHHLGSSTTPGGAGADGDATGIGRPAPRRRPPAPRA